MDMPLQNDSGTIIVHPQIQVGDMVQWDHGFLYGSHRIRKGRVVKITGAYCTVQPGRAKQVSVAMKRLTVIKAIAPNTKVAKK